MEKELYRQLKAILPKPETMFAQLAMGWTKTGVERESWGKRSTSKDTIESLSKRQRKSAPVDVSSEVAKKPDFDIKGFSSSDEDESGIFEPTKTHVTGSKRAFSRSLPVKTRKRQKCETPDFKDVTPIRTFQHHQSDSRRTKQVDGAHNLCKWKAACDFENSFTVSSFSAANLPTASRYDSTATLESPKRPKRKDERSEGEDIAWSDSDSDQPVHGPTENRQVAPRDKTPKSSPVKNVGQDKEIGQGDIDQFDSDLEEPQLSIDNIADKEEYSPSISSNTPTPTPTPTSPKEGESGVVPPIDSSKKKKQKYLRSGLAERLRKLLLRENSEKSFWFHKLQQRKEDEDNVSRQADGTVTLRVVSDDLDHGVHVIKGDVISQDVISERELPDQVMMLLDNEIRRQLKFKTSSSYLRIYSPWKIFDLSNCSLPVLLCITHCEVIHDLPLHLQAKSATTKAPVSVSFNQVKVLRTKLFPPLVCKSDLPSASRNEDEQHGRRNESGNENEEDRISLAFNLQDTFGVQGLCLNARINITVRIQRVYWRWVRKRSQTLLHKSLCLLVQDSTGFWYEIGLPSDILMRRRDWQQLMCQAEGVVFSFTRLRFVEHRKRKRRLDVFGLIDSLRYTRNKERNTKTENSKYVSKQNVFCVLSMDDETVINVLPEGKANVCSLYCPPSLVRPNDLQAISALVGSRVKLCGRLLYARFKTDNLKDSSNIRLFISAAFIADKFAQGNGSCMSGKTRSEYFIQVRYSSGRAHEWNLSTLIAGQLLVLQDLILEKANPAILIADVFSKIQVLVSESFESATPDRAASHVDDLWRKMMTVPITDVKYNQLRCFPLTVLPWLSYETESDSLVMFEGVIFDVDQVNAFCWLSCNECGSEDISEVSESSLYVCNSCGLDICSPVNNTHLEVYLKSVSSSALCVKAKLLQSTISRLLPATDGRCDEGYDVQCVLDKHLGPMSCYVLEKFDLHNTPEDSKICFKLEELDASCWTQ